MLYATVCVNKCPERDNKNTTGPCPGSFTKHHFGAKIKQRWIFFFIFSWISAEKGIIIIRRKNSEEIWVHPYWTYIKMAYIFPFHSINRCWNNIWHCLSSNTFLRFKRFTKFLCSLSWNNTQKYAFSKKRGETKTLLRCPLTSIFEGEKIYENYFFRFLSNLILSMAEKIYPHCTE